MIIPPPVLPNPPLRHEPRRVRPPNPRRPVREPHAHDQLGAGGDGVRAEGGVAQGLAEGERNGGEEAEGFGDYGVEVGKGAEGAEGVGGGGWGGGGEGAEGRDEFGAKGGLGGGVGGEEVGRPG